MIAAAARSITFRLALLSALWVLAGLSLVGLHAAGIATRQIEAEADRRVSLLLDAVAAAIEVDAAGRVLPPTEVPDPEFERPLSGSYWQLRAGDVLLRSRSLWDAALPEDPAPLQGARWSESTDPRGRRLRVLERSLRLPGAAGELRLQVAVSRQDTDAAIARLHGGLTVGLALLGTGLVAGVALIVVLGLRPLRHARRALAALRAGEGGRVATRAPAEIAPLLAEIDALLERNDATVERARAHVGNLAHALKTPLTVALTALQGSRPDPATAREQLQALQQIVAHHLARARVAAPAAKAGAARGIRPLEVADEVARALRRLDPERGIEIAVEGDAEARVPVERQDLVELVGNLMENAAKWARHRVRVEVRRDQDGTGATIAVADDGPGLPAPEAAEHAAQRGIRLDEAVPGSGLGLAIVADLAALYGGRLALEAAPELGGLCARVWLPMLPQAQPARGRPDAAP